MPFSTATMRSGLVTGLLLASTLGSSGCAVRYPAGWQERQEPGERIQATPGKMYGVFPRSWDLNDGGRIEIDLEDGLVTSGLGTDRTDVRFTATYDGEPVTRIRCETGPAGRDVPETRFGCWSAGNDEVRFWLAPGRGCAAGAGSHARTMQRSECWNGELITPRERIMLKHGQLESWQAPVGYVTWVGADGALLLAADIVRELQLLYYKPKAGEGGAPPERLKKQLVLLTVSLAFWKAASAPASSSD